MNASGSAVNPGATGFYVNPVRDVSLLTGFTGALGYNPLTNEVGLRTNIDLPTATIFGEYLFLLNVNGQKI